MGCCNEPVSTLTGVPPDPTQHVNYARGMVLGVDDFVQEFAYLAGRDRWLARDAIGYGTASGLRVWFENDGSAGPRLHVSAGTALLPSGQLVDVPADQCAVINKWLAKPENAATVTRLLDPSSPPLSPPAPPGAGETGAITLYLTLNSAECLTRPVPIPGEPCRSEDELMAPSRIADDYGLQLRDKPPQQVEEDALRDFVRWLRNNVLVIDSGLSPPGDDALWLAALRPAAQPWFDAMSALPPQSPPPAVQAVGDYLIDIVPISVASANLAEFLRVALRFWVTELRPLWAAVRHHRPQAADVDSLLLAAVRFDVVWVGGQPGSWQIAGSPATVDIDESRRPLLAHTRLLQEWRLSDSAADPGVAVALAGNPPDVPTVLSIAGTPGQVNVVSVSPGQFVVSAAQAIGPTAVPRFAGLNTSGAVHVGVVQASADLTLDARHHVVICAGGQNLRLPKCSAATLGRVYIVRNVINTSTVVPATGDTVSGPTAAPSVVRSGKTTTYLSDGVSTWHVIATA